MKRKIDVVLLSHRFTVRSDKSERYVQSLVQKVQTSLEEMRQIARAASDKEVALLCALNFADALLEEQEKAAAMRSQVRLRTEALVKKLRNKLEPFGNERSSKEGIDAGLEKDVAAQHDISLSHVVR